MSGRSKRRSASSDPSAVMPEGLDGDVCTFCGATDTTIELDHFPVAHAYHGTEVVPVCVPCHDILDRGMFDRLPGGMVDHAFAELIAKLPDAAVYVGSLSAHTHMRWERWLAEIPGREVWASLSPLARLTLVRWTKARSAHLGTEESMERLDKMRQKARGSR